MFNGGLDFQFDDTLTALQDSARAFARKEIAPIAARVDQDNLFPNELWKKLGDLGVLTRRLQLASRAQTSERDAGLVGSQRALAVHDQDGHRSEELYPVDPDEVEQGLQRLVGHLRRYREPDAAIDEMSDYAPLVEEQVELDLVVEDDHELRRALGLVPVSSPQSAHPA